MHSKLHFRVNRINLVYSFIFFTFIFVHSCSSDQTKLSDFEKAAFNLGFKGLESKNLSISREEQQEALLQVFYFAGYFRSEVVWEAIVNLELENPEDLFKKINKVLEKNGASQDNFEKFDAGALRKDFLGLASLDENDIADFILYFAQNAFAREKDKERYQLSAEDWMNKYEKEYLQAVAKLGLIDRVEPTFEVYDEAWIAGASRQGFTFRILDYVFNLKAVKVLGLTILLAGNRPLWAEIDGMTPKIHKDIEFAIEDKANIDDMILPIEDMEEKIQEGRDYMAFLAKKNSIKINSENEFIIYNTTDKIPKGFVAGRTYLNYFSIETGILTETTLANELAERYFLGRTNVKVRVINTESSNSNRPTTATTARDAVKKIIERVKRGEDGCSNNMQFRILLHSNQPYVERQTLVVQKEVDQELEKVGVSNIEIVIDGVGYANRQSIAVIHSELGALINEKYIKAVQTGLIKSRRDIKTIQYSTRKKSIVMKPIPKMG